MNKINILFYVLISFPAYAEEIPSWITNTKREDSSNHYIVCSSDAENPDEARKKAEYECLGSVFKLKGIPLETREIVTLSLEESSYLGVTQSKGVQGNVACNYTDQFIERSSSFYRIWLRCRISKEELLKIKISISDKKSGFQKVESNIDDETFSLAIGDPLDKLKEYAISHKLIILQYQVCLKNYGVSSGLKIKNTIYCFDNLSNPLIGKCTYHNLKCL